MTQPSEHEDDNEEEEEECIEEHAIYAIGDLHGDVKCAIQWVQRTKLIENLHHHHNETTAWKWKDPTSKIIFVGDYIDKGPTSRQTVEFVKLLTDTFPDNVIAIMGNHEMELLKDRDEEHRSPHFYYQLPYATVHPGEYLHYISSSNDDQGDDTITTDDETDDEEKLTDEIIIDLLYNASIEVYGKGAYKSTIFAPSVPPTLPSHTKSIIDYVYPSSYRPIVAAKLASYQRSYLNAYRSNTSLGAWMESRPILYVAEEHGTLFVHGGISKTVSTYFKYNHVDVDSINTKFQLHAKEDTISEFMETTIEGRIADDVVFYRGNHLDHGGSCEQLMTVLDNLGVERIAVGHTPSWDVRVHCDGRFLALDSMLGRWIRGSGNNYCPMEKEVEGKDGNDDDDDQLTLSEPRSSLNGRYQCERINHKCQGQIVRIRDKGQVVEVIV
uniref:Calcineurin-like phosphoesterase domain-containing protein n=1 Tax=Ditylum brightwellii TaxID=49249 RepID=A0A7S2EK27_9STRA